MEYQATIRIPTKEPYAYIEATVLGTPESIKEAYDNFTSVINGSVPSQGLSEAEFRPILDKFLKEGTVESGLYEQMGPEQQRVMQCLKRAFARIKSKESRLSISDFQDGEPEGQ